MEIKNEDRKVEKRLLTEDRGLKTEGRRMKEEGR